LQSSLPFGTPLQPSSTDVYKAELTVKDKIFFTPSKYRLRFNVNYSFDDLNAYLPQMAINLKTAKNLGLDMPTPVLACADEVIE